MEEVKINKLYGENVGGGGKKGFQMFILKNYQPVIHTDHLVFISFGDELTEALSD